MADFRDFLDQDQSAEHVQLDENMPEAARLRVTQETTAAEICVTINHLLHQMHLRNPDWTRSWFFRTHNALKAAQTHYVTEIVLAECANQPQVGPSGLGRRYRISKQACSKGTKDGIERVRCVDPSLAARIEVSRAKCTDLGDGPDNYCHATSADLPSEWIGDGEARLAIVNGRPRSVVLLPHPKKPSRLIVHCVTTLEDVTVLRVNVYVRVEKNGTVTIHIR
jgi:hypothetical protein